MSIDGCSAYPTNLLRSSVIDLKFKNMTNLSVIILTYNEEKNLDDCLKSVNRWAKDIFIVDSFSTDKTQKIARNYTDKIYQHPFENQSRQLNWALENLPIETEWVMRLDADEKVTDQLKDELTLKLSAFDNDITGLYVNRKVFFMGRWIKHGGFYPTWLLRIWRKGKAYCEDRWLNEHIKLTEGKVTFLQNHIIDENKKNLHWWIGKHNNYSTRYTVDLLNAKHNFQTNLIKPKLFGTQEQRKVWLKEKVYVNSPLFVRPFLYFAYRYFLKFGFLDGIEGLIWHFLQGLWYMFLVDAKIYEIHKKAGKNTQNIKEFLKKEYGLEHL